AVDETRSRDFVVAAEDAQRILAQRGGVAPADYREAVTRYLRERRMDDATVPALAALSGTIAREVQEYGTLTAVPAQAVQNVRNDMYLAAEALRLIAKNQHGDFDDAQRATLHRFEGLLGDATKYIPDWVKIAVAIALGLGTMVGWKRI